MKAATTGCGKYGHREFSVEYDESLVPTADVKWLLAFLEETVASGTKYQPQETLRVGWTDMLIEEAEGSRLRLLEPDWEGVLPFDYVPSVTKTLLHLRRQKDVAESLELLDRLSFPTLGQSAVTCNRLGKEDCGVMDRAGSEGHDSGWFFGCNSPDHDHNEAGHLERLSLYEVACRLPATAQFCALPTGTNLFFDREGGLLVLLDGKEVPIRKGSYLHELRLRTVH